MSFSLDDLHIPNAHPSATKAGQRLIRERIKRNAAGLLNAGDMAHTDLPGFGSETCSVHDVDCRIVSLDDERATISVPWIKGPVTNVPLSALTLVSPGLPPNWPEPESWVASETPT